MMPSSPTPSPANRGATLLPPSLPPRREFIRQLPTATGCRNDAARICRGAMEGGAWSTAVEPSTAAQEGSAGGEGERSGRRQGA
jgi:hypothetical protein